MNISFNLKNPSAKISPIRLIVTHRSKIYRKAIGLSVETAQWSKTKQKSSNIDINRRLNQIKVCLESNLNEMSNEYDILDCIELAITGETVGKRRSKVTFNEFAEEYANAVESQKSIRKCGLKLINEATGGRTTWESVDIKLYYKLLKLVEEGKIKNSTFNVYIVNTIRGLMRKAHELGYHNNMDFERFKSLRHRPFAIYLNKTDIEKIKQYTPKYKVQDKVKDLLLVGIYTASRYSDYSRLSYDNIVDGRLQFMQKKTKKKVIIPLSPVVKEILDKYNGKMPYENQNAFNIEVKLLCKNAGITDIVELPTGEKKEKYKLVSAHTARRTGATLLYMGGLPVKQCMLVTGHSSEMVFYNYVKTTIEESLDIIERQDFFQ